MSAFRLDFMALAMLALLRLTRHSASGFIGRFAL